MKILLTNVFVLILMTFIHGCGVGWLPKLTKEELRRYDNVIDLSKDRYANFRSSFGLSKFNTKVIEGTKICTFQIATNNVRELNSLSTFIGDMNLYCKAQGGVFEDLIEKNKNRKNKLIRKHTTKRVEKIAPCFECGPKGKGTISCDWTKFNPSVCRKLSDQIIKEKIDWNLVNMEYGIPSDFVCKKNKGALFVGSINRTSDGNVVLFNVRLNQKENGLIREEGFLKLK